MAINSQKAPEDGIAFGRIEAKKDLVDPHCLNIEDFCSHACAVKRFSQWLGTL
jgi:hypothetical protein